MTQRTRAQIASAIAAEWADNSDGDITPAKLRAVVADLKDSVPWHDEVVADDDARLTNARTPTAHSHDSLYRRPVVHGDNASMARPSGAAFVEWIGSVEPTNAENADTWLNTAEA